MKYTKQELIDELHRFIIENGRNPTRRDMNNDNGYISHNSYIKYFGSWNNALKVANIKLNKGYINEEFLISELHRFVKEESFVPNSDMMSPKYGYPSFISYIRYFGSWNNALIASGYEVNQTNEKRTGLETCCKCGNYLKQGQRWITKGLLEDEVMCTRCYKDPNYLRGDLDPNTSTGLAFIAQRIVMKVFKLDDKYDCNLRCGFNFKVDIYDKGNYDTINVKSCALYDNTYWIFNIRNINIPDTYICLGFGENRKNVEHVWIVDSLNDFVYNKQSFTITSGVNSLNNHKHLEVDAKHYNAVYHNMNLNNCKYLRSD